MLRHAWKYKEPWSLGRFCRSYGQKVLDEQEAIRNIGILAHIDAGNNQKSFFFIRKRAIKQTTIIILFG